MVFCSLPFLFFFLPLALVVYYVSPKRFRNAILFLFSLYFYATGEFDYLWLIFVSIFFNYLIALGLQRFSNRSKALLGLGVGLNLGALIYFKYGAFLAETLQFSSAHLSNLVLPLGISFYTFHSISYLIDVYRQKSEPQRNLLSMGLYIVNFSQLVAGPIIRYHDVEKQLHTRLHSWHRFQNGLQLFIYGLAKKMLIANVVGEFADSSFNQTYGPLPWYVAWVAALAYALQIYFDFSGYSDMAIGIGRMFGFEFKKNFRLPYAATSIREFWQKWHISLSSWFRDYVYIPLGGNRKGSWRTGFNLMCIFVLCGFWHGANFTFLVWGLLHGFFISLERFLPKKQTPNRLRTLFGHLYVWLILLLTWVFFRAESLTQALDFLKSMLSFQNTTQMNPDFRSFLSPYFISILIIGLFTSLGIFSKLSMRLLKQRRLPIERFRMLQTVFLILLFYLSFIQLITSDFNPFIYYRF